ncbi:TetR/AcrR family transcriptional regulator [Desulfitobacterium metallireducens]|uniref:Transcriptional regulator n=1 Tax=Desulfitobacterium metallireducens DSM 15288 TaxID=871968 RepID=W0EB84_9FIRM|nr:TetR/AcrR family transcriptional regulator [Desulfitobacterium metallireducens]AHF08125.1 transcriptional regulator [Desulfitobacterium metallireducens DSM 15288]
MIASREEKFQRILDAATEAFAESGYYQCQVSKIARLAGVADGTIYLYFKNKEEILIRLFEVRMGHFIDRIRSGLESCETTRMRLRTIIQTHFSNMVNDRSLAVVTQLELRQSDPSLRAAISGPLRDYFRLIEEVIQEGIECQEVTPINIKVARQMIFGTLDEATTDWLLARTERNLLDEVDPILELLARALCLPEKE